MIAVRMVKPAVHQEVDVIPVRNPLVPAVLVVLTLTGRGLALRRIRLRDLNSALIEMSFVLLVQVPVVNVVDMVAVPDLCVSTGRAVLMPMPLVNLVHP